MDQLYKKKYLKYKAKLQNLIMEAQRGGNEVPAGLVSEMAPESEAPKNSVVEVPKPEEKNNAVMPSPLVAEPASPTQSDLNLTDVVDQTLAQLPKSSEAPQPMQPMQPMEAPQPMNNISVAEPQPANSVIEPASPLTPITEVIDEDLNNIDNQINKKN